MLSDDAYILIRYANGRHSYSFPRVVAMLGDGKTSYDHDNDGDATSLAACSVCFQFQPFVIVGSPHHECVPFL